VTSDDRPIPQYGEYASDSERESAIVRSGGTVANPDVSPPAPQPTMPVSGPVARSTPGVIDRLATIFLLAFGLIYTIGGASSYLDLGTSLERMFVELGVGHYHATSMTSIIGVAIVASEAVLWLIATVWSYVRLGRGKRAWWVPAVFGLASFIVSIALLGVLLAADPVFLGFVTSA
jgi:hypothetical protein